MKWLFLLAVPIAIAFALHFRRRLDLLLQRPKTRPAIRTVVRTGAMPRNRQKQRHYYGAMLKTGARSCEAARAIERQRYLAGEAPGLPLADCTLVSCDCRMLPLADRRAGHDRRDRFIAYGDFDAEFNHERREDEDRRKP